MVDVLEAVLICGVNLSLSPLTYVSGCGAGTLRFSFMLQPVIMWMAGMHSHLGRCFTYNFSADGYTRGEARRISPPQAECVVHILARQRHRLPSS